MVGPVDADVVDLVLAVAQRHDTVYDAARVGGQRRFGRLVRGGSADERPGPLRVVRRSDTLGGELADVIVCLALLAQILHVDLAMAVSNKIEYLEARNRQAELMA